MHIEGIDGEIGSGGDIPKNRSVCLEMQEKMSLKESFSVCFDSVMLNVICLV